MFVLDLAIFVGFVVLAIQNLRLRKSLGSVSKDETPTQFGKLSTLKGVPTQIRDPFLSLEELAVLRWERYEECMATETKALKQLRAGEITQDQFEEICIWWQRKPSLPKPGDQQLHKFLANQPKEYDPFLDPQFMSPEFLNRSETKLVKAGALDENDLTTEPTHAKDPFLTPEETKALARDKRQREWERSRELRKSLETGKIDQRVYDREMYKLRETAIARAHSEAL